MCDPGTLTTIALMGASTVANSIGASQRQRARDDALAAERIRQRQYDAEAQQLNTESQDKYKNFEGQQTEKAGALTEMFNAQKAEAAKSAGTGAMPLLPASSSNLTVTNEGTQRGRADAAAAENAANLGNLRAFGDVIGSLGREQARNAGLIGQIGGFKRGSSGILPLELEAANQKGQMANFIGDMFSLAGSLGGGGGIKNMFGIGASKAFPSAPSAFGDPWATLRSPNTLYGLY